MSEHLLTGITISISASFLVGAWSGAVQGFCGVHSARRLRTDLVCENVWVIVVLGTEALQMWLAFYDTRPKDFLLICVIFALTLPTLGWVYSQSKAFAATAAGQFNRTSD